MILSGTFVTLKALHFDARVGTVLAIVFRVEAHSVTTCEKAV